MRFFDSLQDPDSSRGLPARAGRTGAKNTGGAAACSGKVEY